MSCPKQLRLKIGDLPFGPSLKSKLAQMDELAGYDLDGVELIIKQKQEHYIADPEQAMKNLLRYEANNRHLIPTIGERQIINKKLLTRMMKVSRPTLDRWIDAGFITPMQVNGFPTQTHFSSREVESQLRAYQLTQLKKEENR